MASPSLGQINFSMGVDATAAVAGAQQFEDAVVDAAQAAQKAMLEASGAFVGLGPSFDFAADAAGALNDWEDAANRLRSTTLPALSDVEKGMRDMAEQSAKVKLSSLIEATQSPLERLQRQLSDLQGLSAFAETAQEVEALDRALQETQGKIQAVSSVMSGANRQTASYADVNNRASQAALNLSRIISDAPFGLLGIANNLEPMIQSFQATSKAIEDSGQKMSTFGAIMQSMKGPAGVLVGAGVLGGLAALWPVISKGANEAFLSLQRFMNGIDPVAKGFQDAFKKITDAAKQANLEVENSLTNTLKQLEYQLRAINQGVFDAARQQQAIQLFIAQDAIAGASKNVDDFKAQLDDATEKLKATRQKMQEERMKAVEASENPQKIRGSSIELVKLRKLEEELVDTVKRRKASYDSANTSLQEANRHASEVASRAGQIDNLQEAINKKTKEHEQNQQRVNDAMKEAAAEAEKMNQQLLDMEMRWAAAIRQGERLAPTIEAISEGVAGGDFQGALAALQAARQQGLTDELLISYGLDPEDVAGLDMLQATLETERNLREAEALEIQKNVEEYNRQREAMLDARRAQEEYNASLSANLLGAALGGSGGAAGGSLAGGALGGLIGAAFGSPQIGQAIGEVLGQQLGSVFDELIAKSGALTPIFDGLAVVVKALIPSFDGIAIIANVVGGFLGSLAPIISATARPIISIGIMMGRWMQVTEPIISIFAVLASVLVEFNPLFLGLSVAFELLEPIFRAIAEASTKLYNGFVSFWNGIVFMIRQLPFMENFGTTLEGRSTFFGDPTFGHLTDATEEAAANTQKNTEALQAFTEKLTNVPTGQRQISFARFSATTPVLSLAGGGVTIGNLTVVSSNPQQMLEGLRNLNATRSGLRITNLGVRGR